MADVNGDGIDDLISGSWPGHIFFFPGAEDRTFAARETLIAGIPVTEENAPSSRVIRGYTLTQSGCVAACDWDADGDVDLTIVRNEP